MDIKQKGFTLVELMIVVAIVAILAAVAYPSYMSSVNKGRRADAQNALLNFAALQERFYSDRGSYGGLDDITGGADAELPSNEGLYTISVRCPNTAAECAVANRPQAYILEATPVLVDELCNVLTYTNTSVRGATGNTTDAVNDCW
jgi:type IV pilus assembly protein PilE